MSVLNIASLAVAKEGFSLDTGITVDFWYRHAMEKLSKIKFHTFLLLYVLIKYK